MNKFIVGILVILFFCLIGTKAMSSGPRCESFYEKVYNDTEKEDVNLEGYVDVLTVGIRLESIWDKQGIWNNKKIGKWILKTNEEGYFYVGKVTNGNLSDKIKVNDIVLSINGEDLREIAKDEDKYEILRKDISNLYVEGEKINIKLLRKSNVRDKGKVIEVGTVNELKSFDMPYIDFYVNSINIDEKEGSFDASIETDFLERVDERYFASKAVWDTLVYNRKSDNRLYFEQCEFSEERWGKLNTVDPNYGLKFHNLIKEDRQTRTSYYFVRPNFSYKNFTEDEMLQDADSDFWDNKDRYPLEADIIFKSTSTYKFKNKFNLKSFPFDRQTIKIFIYNEKHDYDTWRSLTSAYQMRRALEFQKLNSIQGWNIVGVDMEYAFYTDPNYKSKFDGAYLEFDVERKSGYYIFKIILPIILILAVCWSAVWIDPKEIESRLTVTIVCLLSLIAYNFVIDSDMPKLEYLTVMDTIILVSYIYATIPNFLSVISFNLVKKDKLRAEKYESYEKKLGLPSYLLIVLIIIAANANANPEHTASMLSWMIPK